jgi:hypothetical protein
MDLSRGGSTLLSTFANALLKCQSVSEMIHLMLNMWMKDSPLSALVNEFMNRFPIQMIGQFILDVKGIVNCIYLLQSSIEHFSHDHPFETDLIVYVKEPKAEVNVQLYISLIGEVIVKPGFIIGSTQQHEVMVGIGNDDFLIEITVHPGNAVVPLCDFSGIPNESGVLIAASTGFFVDAVEYIEHPDGSDADVSTIWLVKLSYWSSWYELIIDGQLEAIVLDIEQI